MKESGYLILVYSIKDDVVFVQEARFTHHIEDVMVLIDSQREHWRHGSEPCCKFAVYKVGDCILDWS